MSADLRGRKRGGVDGDLIQTTIERCPEARVWSGSASLAESDRRRREIGYRVPVGPGFRVAEAVAVDVAGVRAGSGAGARRVGHHDVVPIPVPKVRNRARIPRPVGPVLVKAQRAGGPPSE